MIVDNDLVQHFDFCLVLDCDCFLFPLECVSSLWDVHRFLFCCIGVIASIPMSIKNYIIDLCPLNENAFLTIGLIIERVGNSHLGIYLVEKQ